MKKFWKKFYWGKEVSSSQRIWWTFFGLQVGLNAHEGIRKFGGIIFLIVLITGMVGLFIRSINTPHEINGDK